MVYMGIRLLNKLKLDKRYRSMLHFDVRFHQDCKYRNKTLTTSHRDYRRVTYQATGVTDGTDAEEEVDEDEEDDEEDEVVEEEEVDEDEEDDEDDEEDETTLKMRRRRMKVN